MLNQFPIYRYNNPYTYHNYYNPAFFTPNKTITNIDTIHTNNIEKEELVTQNNQNSSSQKNLNNFNLSENNYLSEDEKTKFNLGPIKINNDRLSLFGFSIAFDDILIIGLIFILLLDSECDYALIIVLGLILLNISFNDLNLFKLI